MIEQRRKMKPSDMEVDRTLLNKIMELNDFTKSNSWEVIQFVYDATYMRYSQKFFQEKMMREAVEKRIISKNTEIDRLNGRVAQLEEALAEAGAPIPEASETAPESDT